MGERLREKRCLIVGGTTGLGLAAARRFLDEGARLTIAGRCDDSGPAALAELSVRGPTHFVGCDAGREGEVERMFRESIDFLGGLDVVYHVAGMSGRRFGDGALHECTAAGWDETIDANLKSVFLSNREAVRHWRLAGRPGAILNMSSVLGVSPSPHFFDTCAYAAAKGGIISLTTQAAARYVTDGIRINAIAPSLIDTPMAARAVGDEAIVSFLRTKQPLFGGPGRPEDCADAAVFLCSDEARGITGVVLPVDGGWRLTDGQFPRPGRTPPDC